MKHDDGDKYDRDNLIGIWQEKKTHTWSLKYHSKIK